MDNIEMAVADREIASRSVLHLLAGSVVSFFTTSITATMGPVGIAFGIAG